MTTEPVLKLGSYTVTRPDTSKKPLAMMIWGPAGTGKTTLAATAPGKKLWISFDPRGTDSLLHRDDVLVVDLAEERHSITQQFKNEDPLGLSKFILDNDISTVVFDSTTNFADMALRDGVANEKNSSIEHPSIATYGVRNARLLSATKNLLKLTGRLNKHMIFLAHEASPERDKEGTVLYITVMLGGQLPEQVPLDLSEVWALYETGGKRTIAVRPCRSRKPMKTRMFVTDKEPEFEWKYTPEKGGAGISDWYDKWTTSGRKIPLPK